MSERFFSATPISGQQAELADDEARHLVSVMRANVGDEIVLFDGSGAEFIARITTLRKHTVELAVASRHEPMRELPLPITLAVALPKGDRQKWLVEKATELGVARLVPLVTQHGVAQPVENALERLRRSVIEACKQCGRNRLLEIAAPQAAGEYFRQAAPGDLRLIADPAGQPLGEFAAELTPQRGLQFAVGPEGGFTAEELAVARAAGWQASSLGPLILRVETAAIAAAAWGALSCPG